MAEKLVRDRIPKLAPGRVFRQAARDEMPGLVLAKLREEARELLATTPGSPEEMEEAADVMDVVDRLETVAPWALRRARVDKAAEFGLFWNGHVMELDREDS